MHLVYVCVASQPSRSSSTVSAMPDVTLGGHIDSHCVQQVRVHLQHYPTGGIIPGTPLFVLSTEEGFWTRGETSSVSILKRRSVAFQLSNYMT